MTKIFKALFLIYFCCTFVTKAQDLEKELDALEQSQEYSKEAVVEDEAEDLDADLADEDDDDELGGAEVPVLEALSEEDVSKASEIPKLEAIDDVDESIDVEGDIASEKETFTGVDPSQKENVEFSELNDLEFFQLADRVRIRIGTSNPVDYNTKKLVSRQQVIFELSKTKISSDLLKRALDTGEFDGPVALVQAFGSSDSNSVKVLIQLRVMLEPTVSRGPNKIYIDFPIQNSVYLSKEAEKASHKRVQDLSTHENSRAGVPKTFLTVNEGHTFTGKPMTLKVKDADIRDVLNLLTEISGKNFVYSGSSQQKVTLDIENSPWDQIFSIILINAKLGYQEIGNTYRIAPATDLKQEIDLAEDAAKKLENLAPLVTKLIPVNYAQASEITQNVESLKSDRGKVTVDTRLNSLVVTDTEESLELIESYVKSIDRQTPLVLIEGRIVNATEDISQTFGVKLIGAGQSPASGNAELIDGSITTTGVGEGGVPLAATAAFGTTKLGGFFDAVRATLTALEVESKVKTLASPRITVLNNKTATIRQGSTRTIVAAGSTVVDNGGDGGDGGETNTANSLFLTQESVLELNVTPQVSSDGYVLMQIQLSQDIPRANASNFDVDTRSANTELLIQSGKTVVIGGIYTKEDTDANSGIPILKDIPIVGYLFRGSNSYANIRTELLMFISPRILNADKALVNKGLISSALGSENPSQ